MAPAFFIKFPLEARPQVFSDVNNDAEELNASHRHPLLFPGTRGGYLNLNEWRADEWTPAVRAAGLEHRTPYGLSHTFATFSIAAGVSLFELARFMGTSADQIDRTYGHRLPDAIDRTRAAHDASLARNGTEVAQTAH